MGRGILGCAHARDVGGKMVVVHQSVGCPKVAKKFMGCHGGIPNIFVIQFFSEYIWCSLETLGLECPIRDMVRVMLLFLYLVGK